MSKNNNKILATTLLKEGKILRTSRSTSGTLHIVECYGHRYEIENAYSKPKIKQIKEN